MVVLGRLSAKVEENFRKPNLVGDKSKTARLWCPDENRDAQVGAQWYEILESDRWRKWYGGAKAPPFRKGTALHHAVQSGALSIRSG